MLLFIDMTGASFIVVNKGRPSGHFFSRQQPCKK
jgi:hypothetical protein